MGTSDYVRELRARVGTRLLLMPGVAAVIHNDRGEILLQRRADNGQWSLPAGAIDPGETPAEAVIREVREETGLDVRPVRVLGVFGGPEFRHRYESGDESEYTVVVFACRVDGGELGGKDDETLELHWFPVAGMPRLPLPYPRSLFDRVPPAATLFARPDGGAGP